MSVRYIRVNPISNLFAPATRAFGNIAVLGIVTPGATPPADIAVNNTPIPFTDPVEAKRRCPGDLGNSIERCFLQTPGPSLVWGVRVNNGGGTPDWQAALDSITSISAQIVTLAKVDLTNTTSTATGPMTLLVNHVVGTSNTGADGQERIGVAQLPKGVTSPAIVAGTLANDRMVYIAHNSDEDAAAAVAGTIAGYQPHVSLLLKPVNINSPAFTATQIDTINGGAETPAGPAGAGVNWLASPNLLGPGVYMGEAYTGTSANNKKFIDVTRILDDVSFKLKAQLIKTVGALRISRAGLRGLVTQIEVVLVPYVDGGILNDFNVHVPLLNILDKAPADRTPAEDGILTTAQAQRTVQIAVSVSYAAAIHRINIDLVFK